MSPVPKLRRVGKFLRSLDPNDDRTAEPLSWLAVLVVLVLSGVSMFLFLRWKIEPMQDAGHHVAMTAVATDYSRPGSIYPAIYKPLDYFNTNSLFYLLAGITGKVIGPSWSFRIWAASYLGLVPLANLYALRVFGRSAWGAVIAVPLAYNMSYAFGFTNFLFAAPFAILSLPLFYRMLVLPSWRRVVAVAFVLTLLFLAHVQVFLWTGGVILVVMALVALHAATSRRLMGRPGVSSSRIVTVALVSIVPSMGLLARWMWRSKQPQALDEFSRGGMGSLDWASFKAAIAPPSQLLASVYGTTSLIKAEEYSAFIIGLLCLFIACTVVGRLHAWKRPPVMELACALTFASYFFLPEHAGGQAVIGSRQIGVAMWFASAFFAPVPSQVSRLARWGAIVAMCALSIFHLSYWSRYLKRFQKEEAFGLEEVLAAAPPRKTLHYVNRAPGSNIYPFNTFWHVEKWYMADKLGQCNENPAWGSQNPIRYRKAYDFHRPENHEATWVYDPEIWDNYDIILTHHFAPSAAELAVAQDKGQLLAKKGTWELWRSKKHYPLPSDVTQGK